MSDESGSSAQKRMLKLLHGSFSSTYLTLISIIQGAALGYLISVTDQNFHTFRVDQWLLVVSTFLTLVNIWDEYRMGASMFVWIPTFLDSIIPFILGGAELILIRVIPQDLKSWLFIMSFANLSGMIAFINMYRNAAKDDEENREVLQMLGRYIWLNPVWCAIYSVLFATFGAIHFCLELSQAGIQILALLSLILVIGFLTRSIFYWDKVTRFTQLRGSKD